MNKVMSYGAFSARAFFWLIFCPRCNFEAHIKELGYDGLAYGQKVIHTCPDCKTRIVKIVGETLGDVYEGVNLEPLETKTN